MSKAFAMALSLAVALPLASSAHEGHIHKVMGTVAARDDQRLEVKATDGKTASITLNDATKILRGKARVKADDIKPGERVVVAAKETKGKDGKSSLIATEIRLAISNGGTAK